MNLPNCSRCGRFCVPKDEGTYYGSCNDTEPNEPEFFCAHCAQAETAEAIAAPDRVIINCWWMKPDFVRVAKSILRHRRSLA